MTDDNTQNPEPQTPPPPQQQVPPPAAAGTPTPTTSNSENKIFAILSYLPFPISLVGIIIIITQKKDDRYAVFHAKQGIVLLVAWVISGVLWGIPGLNIIAGPIVNLALFIVMIIGIINAANGEEKPLPVLGQFADKFNI